MMGKDMARPKTQLSHPYRFWMLVLLLVSTSLIQQPAFAHRPTRLNNTVHADPVDPSDPSIFYTFQPVATTGMSAPVFVTNAGGGCSI